MCAGNCGKCISCCVKLALGNALKLGVDGQDGATWYVGSGAPSGGLGNVNDLYLNVSNGDVWKKTALSTWTLQGNLKVAGATWYTGGGAPAGGLGVVNDLYLDTATGDVYKKTGVSTWTFQLNIKGQDGTNARTTLESFLNVFFIGDTVGVSTIFSPFNVTLNSNILVNDADSIYSEVVVQAPSTYNPTINSYCKLIIEGVLVGLYTFTFPTDTVIIETTIDRVDSTHLLITSKQVGKNGNTTAFTSQTITVTDATDPITIDLYGNTHTNGDLVCTKRFTEYKPI